MLKKKNPKQKLAVDTVSCASASHGDHLKGDESGGRGVCQSHCLAQSKKHFALLNCGNFKVIMREDKFQFIVKLLCIHWLDYWWETVGCFAVMWNFLVISLSRRSYCTTQSACDSSDITDLQETADWGFVHTYIRTVRPFHPHANRGFFLFCFFWVGKKGAFGKIPSRAKILQKTFGVSLYFDIIFSV